MVVGETGKWWQTKRSKKENRLALFAVGFVDDFTFCLLSPRTWNWLTWTLTFLSIYSVVKWFFFSADRHLSKWIWRCLLWSRKRQVSCSVFNVCTWMTIVLQNVQGVNTNSVHSVIQWTSRVSEHLLTILNTKQALLTYDGWILSGVLLCTLGMAMVYQMVWITVLIFLMAIKQMLMAIKQVRKQEQQSF